MAIILKLGSTGEEVKKLQRILEIAVDGNYGNLTVAAVKNFQQKKGLFPSGEIDSELYQKIFKVEISSDLSETYSSSSKLSIQKFFLSPGQYNNEAVKKKSIFVHHTAGWENPYNTISSWDSDDRGKIGCHYVIGGINPVNNSSMYDGLVLQCMNDDDWVFHLGVSNENPSLDKTSIGIELCNFGYAEKKGNDFYTYTNTKVNPANVIDLGKKFRGYQYWVKYSDKQIQSLKTLIEFLCKKHSINIKAGMNQYVKQDKFNAFEFKADVLRGSVNGVFCHSTVRKDKYDMSPQPKLIEMFEKF